MEKRTTVSKPPEALLPDLFLRNASYHIQPEEPDEESEGAIFNCLLTLSMYQFFFRQSCSVSRLDLDMWTLTTFSGFILFTSRSSTSKAPSTPIDFHTCRAKIIAVLLRTQNSAQYIWE